MPPSLARFLVSGIPRGVTAAELEEALQDQLYLDGVELERGTLRRDDGGEGQEAEFEIPDEEADLVRGPMKESKVFFERFGTSTVLRFNQIGRQGAPAAKSTREAGAQGAGPRLHRPGDSPELPQRSTRPSSGYEGGEPRFPAPSDDNIALTLPENAVPPRANKAGDQKSRKAEELRRHIAEDPPSPGRGPPDARWRDNGHDDARHSVGPEMAHCTNVFGGGVGDDGEGQDQSAEPKYFRACTTGSCVAM